MQVPASARHQKRRLACIVRRIKLRLRGHEQCTHDLGLIVVDRLVQRRITIGITRHAVCRIGLREACDHLRQAVCRGVVQRAVSRLISSLGIGTTVDQPQSGIRATVFHEPHQRRTSHVVGGIHVGPCLYESGKDLAVPISGRCVERSLGTVVGPSDVGSMIEQHGDYIAESLTTGVVEGRITLGITSV